MAEIQNMNKEELIELLKSDKEEWNNLRSGSIWVPDLSGANLSYAGLSGADLRRADLNDANLSGANLRRAGLSGADLRRADLSSANLSSANLSYAGLSGADLRRADLSSANLSGADLSRTNLSGADLNNANLSRTNLRDADLENLKHINTNSHDLLAELLRRDAKDDWQKRSIAGLILISRDWCYKDLLSLPVPEELKQWAIEVLSKYPDFKKRLKREEG